MAEIIESTIIPGVKFAVLRAFADERGRFVESFRKEWFPERTWERVQTNRSDSKAGVLRGLHHHRHQVDYWYCVSGTIRVALADLRPDSPGYLKTETVEIGEANQTGIFIPVGVAHGFVGLTDATLTYIVDNYYDGADEYGVAWDDPTLAIDWGIRDPILSPRDKENQRLEISADESGQ
jgi:dTDP-4-dehydrorhamnose 3,5-epimerase